jgi:orotate phosphoribosyltransferase
VTVCPRPGGDPWARSLDVDRFRAGPEATGAEVLLLDDTWASGASAQSAAVALKQAGARAVAVVVIGRHVPHRRPQVNRLRP